LTELSTCSAVSTSPASSAGLAVVALVVSWLPNWAPPPLASSGLLSVGNSGRSLKAHPKCYI
jgi:hypothetical protein